MYFGHKNLCFQSRKRSYVTEKACRFLTTGLRLLSTSFTVMLKTGSRNLSLTNNSSFNNLTLITFNLHKAATLPGNNSETSLILSDLRCKDRELFSKMQIFVYFF